MLTHPRFPLATQRQRREAARDVLSERPLEPCDFVLSERHFVPLDSNELVRRAEREVAAGSRSAAKTLDRARQDLLRQRDTEGLEHLLELAGRLDKPDNLTKMIEQNLKLLGQQAQDRPASTGGSGVDSLIAGLIGGFVGAVVGIALTVALLSSEEADPFVWLAAGLFFVFLGVPLGAGLAIGLWHFSNRKVNKPS